MLPLDASKLPIVEGVADDPAASARLFAGDGLTFGLPDTWANGIIEEEEGVRSRSR